MQIAERSPLVAGVQIAESSPLVAAQGEGKDFLTLSRGNTQFFFFISFFSSPFPHTLLHSLSHSLTPISTLKKYERGEPYYSLIGVPVVREGEPHICCSFLSVSSHAVSGRVQQSRVKRAPTSWSESLRKHQETRKHQGDDGQSGTLETDVISCL